MRDEAVSWEIVKALEAEQARRPMMMKEEKRQLIRHRLAQTHHVGIEEIASGRDANLNSTLTRIYSLANPRWGTADELAEARRLGVGFHDCYSISNGRKSLAEILQDGQAPIADYDEFLRHCRRLVGRVDQVELPLCHVINAFETAAVAAFQ